MTTGQDVPEKGVEKEVALLIHAFQLGSFGAANNRMLGSTGHIRPGVGDAGRATCLLCSPPSFLNQPAGVCTLLSRRSGWSFSKAQSSHPQLSLGGLVQADQMAATWS